MNWIRNTTSLIGRFWSRVFHENELVQGVLRLHSELSEMIEYRLLEWYAGRSPDASSADRTQSTPFPVYLMAGRPAVTGESGTYTSLVTKPAATVDAILGGTAAVGDLVQAGGWTCVPMHAIKPPAYLTDHVSGWTRTLTEGFDYDWQDGYFLFHTDPSQLGLPEAAVTDASGTCIRCWKVFGWTKPALPACEPAAFCESPELREEAGTAWRMHQTGASVYLVKKLLGDVTGSVVCSEAGVLERTWTEQGHPCCTVSGHVYTGPAGTQCNYAQGGQVPAGGVLYGDLVVCQGSGIPAGGISALTVPGVRVRTDAGELIAGNSTQAAVVQSSVNILPLSGDASVLAAYRNRCVELASDVNCPSLPVPASVNPFMFVMQKLRRGRSVFVSMVVKDIRKASAALACIRRNAPASGIIDVYARAAGDTVGVTVSGFTAEAGNAAVSVDATVTVKSMAADAGVTL